MSALSLNFDTKTTISLESQLERLALESSVLDNVISTFRNVIPNLSSKLNQIAASIKSEEDHFIVELNETRNTFKVLKPKLPHVNYIDYNKTLVSVPEGFKGDLLEYVMTLTELAPSIFQEANKTLGEYNFVLSAFITNKENKISLKDHSDLFLGVQRRRESMTKEMAKFFPTSGDLSKAYLSDTIKRFADLEVLVKASEGLVDSRKQQNLKELVDNVNKATSLLDIIVKDSENNGIAAVSGTSAMNISNGAYEIGKFVEFVAIYRYRVSQAISSVNKIITKLNEIT